MIKINMGAGKMGATCGLLSAATFGLIPLFTIPLLAMGANVETVLFYRFAIATFAMAILIYLRGESFVIGTASTVKIGVLSIFYMLCVRIFFEAFWYLPSGWVATITFLFPVMVMVIMVVFFHEPFRWSIAISLAMAFAGVALLAFGAPTEEAPGAIWDSSKSLFGMLIALVAALFNALYFVGIQVCRLRVNGLIMTFYVMLFGTLFCLVNALFLGRLQLISSPRGIILALLLALITAVFSNLTLILAISLIGSTLSAILSVAEPVTAMTIGIIVFGEPFTPQLLLAVLIILGSVMVALLAPRLRHSE